MFILHAFTKNPPKTVGDAKEGLALEYWIDQCVRVIDTTDAMADKQYLDEFYAN